MKNEMSSTHTAASKGAVIYVVLAVSFFTSLRERKSEWKCLTDFMAD